MDSTGLITQWLNKLSEGDRAGVQRLWEVYYHKLVQLAYNRLQGMPQAQENAEDVALSAFKSFCLAAEQQRFPKLEDREDLWQILVMLTRNKAVNVREHETRDKRDYRRVKNQAALESGDSSGNGSEFHNLIRSDGPDPEFAVEMAELLTYLLKRLGDERLCQIVLLKMHGYTNVEIAAKIGRSLATVEKSVALIRDVWSQYL